MTRKRGRLLWPLVLLAACAAAGARLYDEWRYDRDAAAGGGLSPGSSVLAPATGSANAALALPPAEQFAVIAERPLFAQSRRPPPPAPAPTAEPTPPAQAAPAPEPVVVQAPAPEPAPAPTVDFTLVGIVTSGNERYALVRRQSDGAVVEIPESGDISGWFAVRIDPERAIFRQGGTEEELSLKFDTPVPPEQIRTRTLVKQPPAQPADTGSPAAQQPPQ